MARASRERAAPRAKWKAEMPVLSSGMVFASSSLVQRIERAEIASLRAILDECSGDTLTAPIAGGHALYRGPDSPLNKVLGLGFAPLDPVELGHVERLYHDRGAPVQIELSTHADPAIAELLVQRGYRPSGFENVMGRSLSDLTVPARPVELDVRPMRPDEGGAWVDVLTTGFHRPDGSAPSAAHDVSERAALEQIFRDMADKSALTHWLALRNGEVAGGAGVSVRDGITQLFGAATHPDHRRRGVQRALLYARLSAGRERGSEFAVITTQPGSKSQENAHRTGFTLLYARSVWLLTPH